MDKLARLSDDTINQIEREAINFARKERIREMILYILNRENRSLEHVHGLPKSTGFWPWSRNRNPVDTRLFQRQYPLAGTGIMLIEEKGYQARGVLAIYRPVGNDQYWQVQSPDEVVFQSYQQGETNAFRMGTWVWSLRVEYDSRIFREARPEFTRFENAFLPTDGFSARDAERFESVAAGMFSDYRNHFERHSLMKVLNEISKT